MTRKDIKQEITDLLMQSYDWGIADGQQATVEALEKAVAAAIEIEREACAKVCESIRHDGYVPPEDGAAADYYNDAAMECAAAIRERSNINPV